MCIEIKVNPVIMVKLKSYIYIYIYTPRGERFPTQPLRALKVQLAPSFMGFFGGPAVQGYDSPKLLGSHESAPPKRPVSGNAR